MNSHPGDTGHTPPLAATWAADPAPVAPAPVGQANDDTRWHAFLLQYYRRCKAAHPSITLREVHHVARKKYESLDKQCNVDLALIANHRKHKRKPPRK